MAVGEFCKVCGGYKDDCPQHIKCPNQDVSVLDAAIETMEKELEGLRSTREGLVNA